MFSVWTPSPPQPPHVKTCVSRSCDGNAHIKFIFIITQPLMSGRTLLSIGENRKIKTADDGHFVEIC